MRDFSSLSPMQTRDIVAVANPETNLGLSQETELISKADRDPVTFNLITWKPEVKDTIEKTKIQLSSSDVSSSKKLPEVKNLESVTLVKQETRDLSKIPKRKSMRRSMSETNLNTVRKMISTFEVKVSQDTKMRTGSCIDADQKTKAQSQIKRAVNLEKPEERIVISIEDMEKSVCRVNKERCDDLVIVPRDEGTIVVEEKSIEQSMKRSDLLSKQRRKRNSVVEVKDDEKKPNRSVRLKDSQLENARGSRLWIFPDEAKDFSHEKDFETRHLDLEDANLIQKKTEESRRENIVESGCRSVAKMKTNKWKNIERSKTHKSANSADSDSSKGPVGQVIRALIVVGFAGLVFMTR